MSGQSIGFGAETVGILESKLDLNMPQSITVYWKVKYDRNEKKQTTDC